MPGPFCVTERDVALIRCRNVLVTPAAGTNVQRAGLLPDQRAGEFDAPPPSVSVPEH